MRRPPAAKIFPAFGTRWSYCSWCCYLVQPPPSDWKQNHCNPDRYSCLLSWWSCMIIHIYHQLKVGNISNLTKLNLIPTNRVQWIHCQYPVDWYHCSYCSCIGWSISSRKVLKSHWVSIGISVKVTQPRFRHTQGLVTALRRRHNGHDGVSNHQPHHCLLNRLFGCRSQKTSKIRVTGLCAGKSPGTGEFPAQIPRTNGQ